MASGPLEGRLPCRALKVLEATLCTVVLGLLLSVAARAQLSPGELSQSHATLEGSGNCLRCHQARKSVDPVRCLGCHDVLAERIESGQGLHAQKGYDRCERCHIEHHGREFELIWWGEEGRDRFDHSLTGFTLEGAHARSSCDDCHRPESIVDPAPLEAAGKDLDRTFLGLDRACLSCHEDEHRGQAAADSCSTCHDATRWIPPSIFDHDRTSFALTGRHERVACTGCHATLQAEAEGEIDTYFRFGVDAFASCTDCHRDPHEGRLGPRCETCHSTAGWSRFNEGAFDHERTRFPLAGAHLQVACTLCHPAGQGFEVERFERCVDCHDDDHLGQFRAEPEGCLTCHTVDGFRPAVFTLEDHQRSNYPLAGAHLAIPCLECHKEIDLGELSRQFAALARPGDLSRMTARQFRFGGTECHDCHGDPHEGEVDRWREPAGCEACHELSSWRAIAFDHDATELPLRGKHEDLRCHDCHSVGLELPEGKPFHLTGTSAVCSSCHEDPHVAQFADDDGTVSCERCHDEWSWAENHFDHDRDSVFPLQGAHLRTPCAECHPVETREERAFIRYKPLGKTCEDCHTTFEGLE